MQRFEPLWLRKEFEQQKQEKGKKERKEDPLYNEFLGLIEPPFNPYANMQYHKENGNVSENDSEYWSDNSNDSEINEYIERELGLSDIEDDLMIIEDDNFDSDQTDSDFEDEN